MACPLYYLNPFLCIHLISVLNLGQNQTCPLMVREETLEQGSATFCVSQAKNKFYNVMVGRTFSSYHSSSSHTNGVRHQKAKRDLKKAKFLRKELN